MSSLNTFLPRAFGSCSKNCRLVVFGGNSGFYTPSFRCWEGYTKICIARSTIPDGMCVLFFLREFFPLKVVIYTVCALFSFSESSFQLSGNIGSSHLFGMPFFVELPGGSYCVARARMHQSYHFHIKTYVYADIVYVLHPNPQCTDAQSSAFSIATCRLTACGEVSGLHHRGGSRRGGPWPRPHRGRRIHRVFRAVANKFTVP